MVSKLIYSEDEEDLFEIDEYFQFKIRESSNEIIFDVVSQIVDNIKILPEMNGISTVCGKSDDTGKFFKLTYVKYEGKIHSFTDFDIIEVDEYLDSINSNQSFINGNTCGSIPIA